MALAVYLLLHERQIMGTTNPRKLAPVSSSKIIGEKIPAYELQRQRIKDETIFTFENTKGDESYQLREDELQEFDEALRAMKGVKNIRPDTDDDLNTAHGKREKEYYEVD